MLPDNEIIRRVQSGERELFGELHARHHERVYRYIAQSIYERETAQDLAGDVWLRAYGAVDAFEPREEHSVVAWLLRIASNRITDHRRRLHPTESWDESRHEAEASTLRLLAPGAEREVMRAEQRRAVRQALGHLSEGDRNIIYLAHQADLSSAEIARALGKPSVSAVTSHLHRAMRHLKGELETSGWFDEFAPEPKESRDAPQNLLTIAMEPARNGAAALRRMVGR